MQGNFILAVIDKDELRLCCKAADPVDKPLHIGVAAHAGNGSDLRFHRNGFAKELDLLRSVKQRPAKRSAGLIADEQHKAFLAPEIVLEMMADTAGFAHS